MPSGNMSYVSENKITNITKKSGDDSDEKTRKKGSNFRRYFREYCDNSSIHGFKYLAEKRSLFERLFWGLLILSSVAACCYLISRIYKKYNQSPVIVSFATKESPIFTIPFPAVTICPMAKADKDKLNFTYIYHQKEDNETITPEEEIRGQYMSLLCDKGTDLFPENLTFTDDFFEVIDQLNIRPLIQCKFIGDEYPCSAVFTPIILDEGVCYTFNMMNRDEIFKENVVHFSNYHKNENKSEWHIDRGYSKDSTLNAYPLRALLSGADNSIQVTFMHFQSDTDYICVEDVLGYSVLLHSPDTIPQLKKQYFQVPFDTVVIAAVQPIMMTTSEQVKKYDPFDRECYFADERWLKFFKIYTPGNCRLECITNYTLKQCGCVNFYMPRDNSTVICGNGNWNCMKNAERQLKLIQLKNHLSYTDEEEDDIDLDDYCDCMPLCTELSYSIEQSQTEWKWNEQLVADRMVEDNKLQKEVFHFSKLSVFFKLDQFLTSQRNELYGPTDFLANFGGLLGLFTGFSLLSLMEIIYFLTLRIFCNRRQYRVWAGNVDKN